MTALVVTGKEKMMGDGRIWIGLDIGGTKTEALVVDAQMGVLSRVRASTDTADPECLLAGTIQLIRRALAQANGAVSQVGGIGIGIPGLVERETGVVRLAVNLNLTAYPLGAAVTAALGVLCAVENDARIATLGVHRWLNEQQPVRHVAYVSIGTGIAAGVVLDGRLYRGAHGMAGEIGHVIVDPTGSVCSCGARGCLETIVAGPAIARQYAEAAGLRAPMTAETVFQAYQAGDAVAQQVMGRVSQALSRALQWLIMTYDVEKVVLGGGVTAAGAAFLDPVLAELAQMRAQSALAQEMLAAHKFVVLPSDFNAGTWGAVALAQQG